MKNVGADWPTSAKPIAAWSQSESPHRGRDADRQGDDDRQHERHQRQLERGRQEALDATSIAGCAEVDRAAEVAAERRSRGRPRTARAAAGRGRARRARGSISAIGASGGSSSGTGSPDSRMTTKTTVETSQSATRARKSRRRGSAEAAHGAGRLRQPRARDRPAGRGLGAAELE